MLSNDQKVADLMAKCVACGLCTDACPSHAHGGCDPFLVMTGKDGNVLSCIGCGKCTDVCPTTDPKEVMMHRKSEALGLAVPDTFVKYGYVMAPADPSWQAGLPPIPPGDAVWLIPGCTITAKVPFLKYAGARALQAVGAGSRELPGNTCCMYPLPLRSLTDEERDVYKQRMGAAAGGRPLVTLCAGCCNELADAHVVAPHITTYLAQHLDAIRALPRLRLKVALEPGCSAERFAAEFEAVVRATGAEPIGNPFGCCGKTVERIGAEMMRERQADCARADVIVVGCPMCFRMYDACPGGKPVLHLAELVALAAGDRSTLRFHRIPLEGI